MSDCHGESKARYTFDQLESRLVNTEGFAKHLAKDDKAAAVLFEKAAKLDATWRIPAYNLASARVLLGERAAALAALAPWLAKEPVTTYVQVSQDSDLRPLLGEKALVALKATGTAKIDFDKAELGYAYSPSKHLIAFDVDLSGWGICNWHS